MNIMNLVSGTAFGLVVVFTYINIIQTSIHYKENRRLEPWVEPFLRFAIAVGIVVSSPLLIQYIASIGAELTQKVTSGAALSGNLSLAKYVINSWVTNSPFGKQWMMNIGIMIVLLIVYVLILALGILICVAVLTRQFKLMIYAAISPIAISALAAEQWQQGAINFLKKFTALALQGFVIIVIIVLYSHMPNLVNLEEYSHTVSYEQLARELTKGEYDNMRKGQQRSLIRKIENLAEGETDYMELLVHLDGYVDKDEIIELRNKLREVEEAGTDVYNDGSIPFDKGLITIAVDVAMLIVLAAILKQSEQISNDLLGVGG